MATNTLTLPAPAKLNLFLHVTGRRADGYHTLQTLFQLLDHGAVGRGVNVGPEDAGALVLEDEAVVDGVDPTSRDRELVARHDG